MQVLYNVKNEGNKDRMEEWNEEWASYTRKIDGWKLLFPEKITVIATNKSF